MLDKIDIHPLLKKYRGGGASSFHPAYCSKGNRITEINHTLKKYKEQVKQNLQSEKCIYHRKKRPADVEPVFANIKNNYQCKRFLLRGIDKVEIETGLLAMAHNRRKRPA